MMHRSQSGSLGQIGPKATANLSPRDGCLPKAPNMTYGQIAYMLGEGYTPRTVGFAMHGADERNTPWHRVINSQGKCSTGRIVLPSDKQQRMLEQERVKFDETGRCDLEEFLWKPRRRRSPKNGTMKQRVTLYKS